VNDQKTVRMVIGVLGAVALTAIVIAAFKPATELTAIGSAAVGALASLLASTKTTSGSAS
jgi:hypothetical protein